MNSKDNVFKMKGRISHWGRQPSLGGANLQCGHFFTEMYEKTKELGSVGGGNFCMEIRHWLVLKDVNYP